MTTASFVAGREAADRPITHLLEPTGQTPLVRLYGSPAVHRLLPTPVALRVAALRGILEWYLLQGRRRARMAALALARARVRRARASRGCPHAAKRAPHRGDAASRALRRRHPRPGRSGAEA